MAAKKKVTEKRLPKPRYKLQMVGAPNLDTNVHALHDDACHAQSDAYVAMVGADEEVRRFVSALAHNYEVVCRALVEAHTLLKDPNVSHAVSVSTRLRDLEKQVAKIEELESDLKRHENDYSHEYRDSYY